MVTTVIPTPSLSAIAGSLVDTVSVVAVATLILLLIVKESVGGRIGGRLGDPRLQFLSKALDGPILALLVVFAVVVVVKVWEIL